MKSKTDNLHIFSASGLIFLGLFVLTGETWGVLATHYLMGTEADPGLYVWLFETPRNPANLFSGNHFYPFARTLAFGDLFYLPYLLAQSLPLESPLSFNLVILGSLFLNGFFTYYLARRFGVNFLSGIFSALAFMSSSYLFSHLGQVQLQFAFFLPLTLLLIKNYFERGNLGYALILGVTIIGAFYTAVYYGIFCILLTGVWSLFALRLRRIKEIAKLFIGTAPSLLFILISSESYRLVRDSFGARNLANIKQFSGSPWAYFSAPKYNLLWGELSSGLSHYEAHLFTGLSTKNILLIGCFVLIKETPGFLSRACLLLLPAIHLAAFVFKKSLVPSSVDTFVYLSCIPLWLLIAFFLYFRSKNSLYPVLGSLAVFYFASLGVVGAPKPGALAIDLNTALRLFPGFDAIRATARYGIVTNLFEVILAGLVLSQIAKRISSKYYLLLASIASVAVLIEARIDHFPRFVAKERPAIFSTLESSPPGAALVLPFSDYQKDTEKFSREQTLAMHWVKNRRLVNGYSGLIPQFTSQLGAKLKGFPDNKSVGYLKRIVGLNYVVYLKSWGVDLNQASFREELVLLETDPEGNMLFALKPVHQGKKIELFLEAKPQQTLSCKVKSLGAPTSIIISQSFDGEFKKLFSKSVGNKTSRLSLTLNKPHKQNRPVKLRFTSENKFELSSCLSS